jgi:hypothetical protein
VLRRAASGEKWLPWHAQAIPQRTTITGRVILAPRRFMSRFMGSSIRMYGTLLMVSLETSGKAEISY